MKKTDESLSLNRVLAFPVLTGLAVTLLAMLVGAFLVKLGRIGEGSIPAFAISALCLGELLTSFTAARRAPRSRLFWGLGAGAVLLLCLAALSLSWFSEPVNVPQLAFNAVISMAAALIGSFIGSRRRKKKKRRK